MNLQFSVYYKNEFGVVKKIDDFISTKEDLIIEYGVGKDYASLVFLVQKLNISDLCIGDREERIFFKFKEGEKEVKTFNFIIESIDFLPEDTKRVYCKSKSYLSDKIVLNKTISVNSLQMLIEQFYENAEILTNYPILFDVEIDNKSVSDVIGDYCKVIGADFYWYNNKVYFEDKKRILKESIAVKNFNEIEDIISFSTSTNKDEVKINTIVFNGPDELEEEIISEAVMYLSINPDPPCVSPVEELIYTDDDGNEYTINPKPVRLELFYNPIGITDPITNIQMNKTERVLIEEFELNDDEYVVLTAGIKQIVGISGDLDISDINYEPNYNIVYFPKTTGKIRISYKTETLVTQLPPKQKETSVYFKATFLDNVIEKNIKYEYNGYYPLNEEFVFDCVGQFGLTYEEAINRQFTVSKYDKDNDVFVEIATVQSDNTGILKYSFSEYGIYKFDDIIVEFFVNAMNVYKGEKKYSDYFG